ncbi:MAG TPA: helix-turn-helix domain-containing protein [Leptospiraceae bacterium]|nr:helix-turn-helix domain-containing protein [Leptospiraceae bacterium]HMW07675.1 helix-turn-helix domain-containing protein [Leptospiraceae bacterium]HMX33809.1 helix-turn-helix domain-containing protein [Leptospiraceae bacterium]HMY33311.1 helix-turn-helix domain-containing protein [Leptospiraceae bacterium]HMZ63048.1 helix-turn-helix domain-containing protein [Leptospiraceae bacterium]
MKKVITKNKSSREVTASILRGLNQAVAHAKGNKKQSVEHRFSILPLANYQKEEIKIIRKKINLSQNLFAKALGVSKKTVEAWESGRNIPQGPAQRILYIMKTNPVLFHELKIISR